MIYNTFSDMMLDNRWGISNGLKACNDKDEIIEKALDAYDFAVAKGIEHHESYKLLKAAIIDELGEETFRKIEKKAAEKFMELGRAVDIYYSDVKSGKLVGYSAEEF